MQRKKDEYASVDAFGAKWTPYLGQIGIPAEQMTQAVDKLMHSEQGLRTGTPEQQQQISREDRPGLPDTGARRTDHG